MHIPNGVETPLYYHTYLGLDKLLTSQKLMSAPAAFNESAQAVATAATAYATADESPSATVESEKSSTTAATTQIAEEAISAGRCPAGFGAARSPTATAFSSYSSSSSSSLLHIYHLI